MALAAELRDHGHEPLLAFAPPYEAYVRKLGFDYAPVGLDLDYVKLQREDTADALKGIDPLDTLRDSLPKLQQMLPQMFEELSQACRDADVLISGHLQPVSRMLHELTGIPFVSVHTNHFGGMQPYAFRHATASVINPFRARHGLGPIVDPVHTDANSPQLALYAISRYIRPATPGWPSHYHVTGFFFLEEKQSVPEPQLLRFLEQGEAPVVISFSSIAHPDPEAMTDLLLDAVQEVGCRAVIQHGWSGLAKNRPLPTNVFSVGFVQHTWLFPRAACIVHAGGSGTPATTLRSGIPAVVIPHVGDQPMWAEIVRALGCAGGVIQYRDLTAAKLAIALRNTLRDKNLYVRAAEVARKIEAEQGVSCARLLIEDLVRRVHRDPCPSRIAVSSNHNSAAAERRELQRRIRRKGA